MTSLYVLFRNYYRAAPHCSQTQYLINENVILKSLEKKAEMNKRKTGSTIPGLARTVKAQATRFVSGIMDESTEKCYCSEILK